MSLPTWPPQISEDAESALLHLARDYALSHSIVYRPVLDKTTADTFTTSVIHAPFSLFPTPFPRRLYEQATAIQTAYNELYSKIACDYEFLEKVIGGNVALVDEFQGNLWKIAKRLKDEGVKQSKSLGLFRSDYLLHSPPPSASTPLAPLEIKQVEFNTISSSFGALSTKVSDLHRYLAATHSFPQSQPPITINDLPKNVALQQLAAGLAEAHRAYGVADAKILFVVQDNERNAFDQRALEWELWETHQISVIRQSFTELSFSLNLGASQELTIMLPAQPALKNEISLVYYRAGYGPSDYTSDKDWEIRYTLEKSTAIKCPSVNLQLAGAKKVQQVLAQPNVLSRFIHDEQTRKQLERTFTGLYPLDYDTKLGSEGIELAKSHPERYVLKPQREGGGNNIYRGDIPPFIAQLEEADKQKAEKDPNTKEPKAIEGYILMDLILPPEGIQNKMIRANEPKARVSEVISELGIYGVALYENLGTEPRVIKNEFAGHLLRTKGRESDEGGVAVGFSVIDSPFLVNA